MRPQGFTLVEVLVVIIIFSIISIAMLAVLTVGRESWHAGTTQIELQQETRRAMDWMIKELREAQLVNITASTIRFKIPIDEDLIDATADDDALDVNGEIEWGADDGTDNRLGWTIEYSLSNGQILRKVFDLADTEQQALERVLANNINVLTFTALSSSEIDILITAQKSSVQGRTMESTLNSEVTFRNLQE